MTLRGIILDENGNQMFSKTKDLLREIWVLTQAIV